MNVQEAEKALKSTFGRRIVQAVSKSKDMTFLAVVQVEETEDGVAFRLWPTDQKDFYVAVTDIEDVDTDRWKVHSSNGTWVFQKPPVQEIADEYARSMKAMGFDA